MGNPFAWIGELISTKKNRRKEVHEQSLTFINYINKHYTLEEQRLILRLLNSKQVSRRGQEVIEAKDKLSSLEDDLEHYVKSKK